MDPAQVAAMIAALPPYRASPPWGAAIWRAVGGLTEVGFSRGAAGDELLLCIGWNGRGVYDVRGELLARDPSPLADGSAWYDPPALTARGVGPLDGTTVSIAGLSGGGLALTTADGWSLQRVCVAWPAEQVVLQPPGADALWSGHNAGCVRLPEGAGDIRAAGFSPTGRVLVVASSADFVLFVR